MHFTSLLALPVVVLMLLPVPACAWWDEGHMQIAYLAYKHLDPAVQDRADALLRLNPDYASWTAGAPDAISAKRYAFVHAATWADDIKTKSDYTDEHDDIDKPTAGQNIGYSDKLRHQYWHFKDTLYSPDGTPLPPPDPVDAVTQLKLMIAALPASSGASDDLRSYDLVWLLHLVGDLHQPLHAITRYTLALKNDRGGNAETLVPATGESIALHFYWDRMFGGFSSVAGAIFDADEKGGLAEVSTSEKAAKIVDPAVWAKESFELAKIYGYAEPIGRGQEAAGLTRAYETTARTVARSQAALAAARLANVLNEALK
jgi:S1/P1 Nuclease